jgi:hypothetical protein
VRPTSVATRAPLVLVGVAVLFGLLILWPEHSDVWSLNDASVHGSMVRWAADRISEGHLPFDGWFPYLSLGASRFHHYQSLPHILTGALSLATGEGTFRWSLYLLLATWPIAVYAGARLIGLEPWSAAIAALVSPLLTSAPGLGYEWGSYVWRGSGAWAQLWGMWALPFSWGFGWQAVAKGRRPWLAAVVLAATICFHLLTGYLALLSIGVFVIVVPSQWRRRLGRAALVVGGALLASAWMLVPLITDAGWTVNDEFSRGTIYYDSFGARRVLTWLINGSLFDAGRLPVLSLVLAAGVVAVVLRWRREETGRTVFLLGLLSMLLFFGRPTFGPLLDLLPGGGDLFLRRFISGVHLAGIYLIGVGAVALVRWLVVGCNRLKVRVGPVVVAAALGASIVTPAAIDRVGFEHTGAGWIEEQQRIEASDGADFETLVTIARERGPGRVYSSLRGQGVARYTIGQVPTFAALLNLQADSIGFTRPTWSLASPAEYRFRADDPDHRDLFGVRYVIWPDDRTIDGATKVATSGRHVLWELPDTGYLSVVNTIAPIAADRWNLGEQMASFLDSDLYRRAMVPTVSFGGRPAAAPTLGPNQLLGRPGSVTGSFADPANGIYGGSVDTQRPGVALVKVSFDPRFQAFVDGLEVDPQMVAPGFVGIPVPEGSHQVVLVYRPYPWYPVLFLIGVASIVGLWWFGRRRTSGLTP